MPPPKNSHLLQNSESAWHKLKGPQKSIFSLEFRVCTRNKSKQLIYEAKNDIGDEGMGIVAEMMQSTYVVHLLFLTSDIGV